MNGVISELYQQNCWKRTIFWIKVKMYITIFKKPKNWRSNSHYCIFEWASIWCISWRHDWTWYWWSEWGGGLFCRFGQNIESRLLFKIVDWRPILDIDFVILFTPVVRLVIFFMFPTSLKGSKDFLSLFRCQN